MNISVTFQRKGGFGHIGPKTARLLEVAVRKTAFDLEARAKMLAPRDTGFLKNSIYAVTNKGSHRPAAVLKASKKAQRPFIESAHSVGPMEAIVAVGAEYGIFVEYGSVHKRNTTRLSHRKGKIVAQRLSDRAFVTVSPAHPYLTPASVAVRPGFINACKFAMQQGARP